MPVTTSKGRGNHRTGATKGRRGKPGQLNWRDDREVMLRVRFVMRPSILNQPVSMVAHMLNLWLEQRGLSQVAESTVRNDIERGLELYRERVVGGADWYRAQFQAQLAEVLLDVEKTPPGKDRAPLRAEARRLLEDMARIDGVWSQVPEPAAEAVFEGEFTSVQDLVESGEIGQQELEVYLSILHRETGGIGATRGARQAGRPDVIDGESETVLLEPRRIAPPRLRGAGGSGAVPGERGRGADPCLGPPAEEWEGDDVVDWTPDED